jgi:anaerobic ribonucleoside-triphosphate reductase
MKNVTAKVTYPEIAHYRERAIVNHGAITYHFEPVPFERIRRITGYLVGSLSKWNDGKRAEEKDRVKHG